MMIDRRWDVMVFIFTDVISFCDIWDVYNVIQMMCFVMRYKGCMLWYTFDVISVNMFLLYDVGCDVLLYDKRQTKEEKIKDFKEWYKIYDID